MIDVDCFRAVMQTMSVADHTRMPEKHDADEFGCAHVVLFGDFKQLPPASITEIMNIVTELEGN